jgi:cellulose biosynthesis protein BcsQ
MTTKRLVDEIVERSQAILTDGDVPARDKVFSTYAVTNFRGGIGKSTLSFNLAYEIARVRPILLLDTCSQRNFSQNLLGDDIYELEKTIYDALVREIAGTSKVEPDDLLVSINAYCSAFRRCKSSFLIPGSSELYLFPSLLYITLAQYRQLQAGLNFKASLRVVHWLCQCASINIRLKL